MSRIEGSKELAMIEDIEDAAMRRLEDYFKKTNYGNQQKH